MESPIRIEVEPAAIDLVWLDGRTTRLAAATLRCHCPCAVCGGSATVGAGGSTIDSARIVGDYALSLTFKPDGHATGIFSYDLLRSLGEPA